MPDGEGPLYWFQSFEYALDHWLQKTTEHVLGSVLCAPGCFSLYRCSAICDVLKTYSQPARSAMDFLTRDMGEDRWLCSLMVQEGCSIAYCQDARVTTHCPTNFQEFLKQRRRWIASTLANVYLHLKDRNKLRRANLRVSEIFLMYHVLQFIMALFSPTVVLVLIAGGISSAFGISTSVMYIVIAVLEFNFVLICLKGNHRTQLVVAEFYALLFPTLMWAILAGIVVKLLNDSDLNFTAGYIVATFGVVLVTGILQGKHCVHLVHGVLFLCSLPCMYLLMSLYTVSNLTDLSWDPSPDKKEEKTTEIKPTPTDPSPDKTEEKTTEIKPTPTESADVEEESDEEDEDTDETDGFSSDYPSIDNWLPDHLRIPYAAKFKKHGYATTNFLTSLTEADLVKLGVDKKGIRMFLMAEIRRLPIFHLKINVKASVDMFLKDIGLQNYLENFKANCLDTAESIQILKHFTEADIKDLGIKKSGHVKRLMSAIAMLRLHEEVYTTEQGYHTGPDERDFRAQWVHLIERTLNPDRCNVVSPDTITGEHPFVQWY
ncbi:chitin synthase chs-2-like [Physella acuta]|uniref:chitin synthase chs-2-like n=1 Tax=Physella acuta TaxID=109671 RepID=UPI0027DAD364|nr:chitin synthase chs-2-like [Physella acuta]